MKDLVRKSESQCGFVYLFCIYPWVFGRYLIFRNIEKEKGGALSGNGFENESFMFRVIIILFDFHTLDWPGIVKNHSYWYIWGVIPASCTNRIQTSQIQNNPQPTTVMERRVLNTTHVNSIHPACASNWLVMDPETARGIPSSFSKPRERCSEGIQDGSRVSECIGQVTVYDTNPYHAIIPYHSSMTWTVSKKLMLYNGFGVLTVLWSYFTT